MEVEVGISTEPRDDCKKTLYGSGESRRPPINPRRRASEWMVSRTMLELAAEHAGIAFRLRLQLHT